MGKHLFSIYLENLSEIVKELAVGQGLEFKNKNVHARIVQVLRLQAGDSVVIFDDYLNLKIELLYQTFENNKNIFAKVLEKNKNKELKPEVIVCPSLTKKHSFEELVYNASAIGATIIWPVITEKVQRKWGFEKERERLKKIIIAACEQSKNYILPELNEPIKLPLLLRGLQDLAGKKILFEHGEKSLLDFMSGLKNHKNGKICLLFGPEAGLTDQEIELSKVKGFETCALTPTILRSQEAVTVGLGIVRSIINT